MKDKKWNKGLTMVMAGFMALGAFGTSVASAAADPGRASAVPAKEAAYSQPYQQVQVGEKNKSDQQKENIRAAENNKNAAASKAENAVEKIRKAKQETVKQSGKTASPALETAKNAALENVVTSSSKSGKKTTNVIKEAQKEAATAAAIKAATGLLS